MTTIRLLLLIALLVLPIEAQAFLPSGSASSVTCPVGNPSPDGAFIVPQSGTNVSCVLTDLYGYQYEYQGSYIYINTGTGFRQYGQRQEIKMGGGGHSYIGSYCRNGQPTADVPNMLWFANTAGGLELDQAVTPDRGFPNEFYNSTRGTNYHDIETLVSLAATGDRMEVKPNPSGLGVYISNQDGGYLGGADITGTNQTIIFNAGAKLGCRSTYGDAYLKISGSGITLNGGEFMWVNDVANGTSRGVNLQSSANPTVENAYFHDNDMGLLQTGGNRLTTLSNDLFIHNGSSASEATTHNVYLSCKNTQCESFGGSDQYTINKLRSYCTSAGGFQIKLRGANGTNPITDSIFAEPDPNGVYTGDQCQESAAVDLPCGGQYVLGGTAAGTGVVIEVGPGVEKTGTKPQYTGLVRFGEEAMGSAGSNCPASAAGWPTNRLLIQNAWLINDDPQGPVAVCYIQNGSNNPLHGYNFMPYVTSAVVKNSKIVGNGTNSTLGQCTDGGGNAFYPNRAAAGLAAFPALPSPM